MKKERQSNYESMRIILMILVVLYHLVLYNGIFATEFNGKTLIGLVVTSGGAIAADYAFICLSTYFLLERKNTPIIRRFLSTGCQILVIYLIRLAVIRGIYGFDTGNTFLEQMIMKGAWWFGYCYLILLLVYPILNRVIAALPFRAVLLICFFLGVWISMNWLRNRTNLFYDFLMFLFAYFCMGAVKKRRDAGFPGLRKRSLLMIYLFCYLVVFGVCVYLKNAEFLDYEQSAALVTKMVGKYFILQAVMGICVFLFFQKVSMRHHPLINRLSKATFFVFLIHETVMGVFWRVGMVNGNTLMYCSIKVFLIQGIMYLLTSFLAGIILQALYDKLVQPVVDKMLNRICAANPVVRIEELYRSIR